MVYRNETELRFGSTSGLWNVVDKHLELFLFFRLSLEESRYEKYWISITILRLTFNWNLYYKNLKSIATTNWLSRCNPYYHSHSMRGKRVNNFGKFCCCKNFFIRFVDIVRTYSAHAFVKQRTILKVFVQYVLKGRPSQKPNTLPISKEVNEKSIICDIKKNIPCYIERINKVPCS